jgi:hypothetical protein
MNSATRDGLCCGVLLVAACFFACGSHEEPQPKIVETPAVETAAPAPGDEVPTPEPPVTPREPLSLADAAQQGFVEYTVLGTDASSGDSLRIEIRRTSNDDVTVNVEPGTVFTTESRESQSMVAFGVSGAEIEPGTDQLERTDTIDLWDDLPHVYLLEAYCLDFELENPSPQDRFVPAAVDSRLATLLKEAKTAGLTMPATQAAIWMDHGHITKQEIQTKFDASDQELEDAWELLQRLPPP